MPSQIGFSPPCSYACLIEKATRLLYESSDSPRIDAEVLLQHVSGKTLAWLIAHADEAASNSLLESYADLVTHRQLGTPIAYLVGHKEFWSLRLMVNEHVLIPRADTETLIEAVLDLVPVKNAQTLLDLGTGSGAIALALAKEYRDAKITAIDSQSQALAVAQQNAEKNSIDNIEFIQGCWFSPLAKKRFDVIASNPPYIEKTDPHLQRGDLRFEPTTALISEGDGLDDIRAIIRHAPAHLNNSGFLFLEHGYQQGEIVKTLLEDTGFSAIQLHYDLNQLPRCTSAQWQNTLHS